MVQFAVATAMRQEEIYRAQWNDIDRVKRILLIRDRKDPRLKQGNEQHVPLFDRTGFDALAILDEQKPLSKQSPRIFLYSARSVGTAFRRACKELKIKNLHIHDLRHKAISRLFEAEFSIGQVALVTGIEPLPDSCSLALLEIDQDSTSCPLCR